ncbi:hypothetical protein ACQZ32_12820 [Ralstonia pseudosolanacearum]|uniref:hypothetical protein n=2 Tax=Ralstonia pseudosolanacearum TaxID=1310165 RepID=UPI0012DA1CE5|nr:hypothetical protein [Ralstonia pseudosolanacearum]MDC6293676.1 hypothetical protein [Ralstonia pseudosolanacearum]MDD7792391.1 hypothetical protein [Ralstonia pseudosolanacearum]MDN3369662.1 hypothetical protein [Ralstonia pseudosolanacearum]QOK86160.1 hypothetical protein HF907_05640 [Ralstonia pseudosolanacearum]
MIEDTAGGWAAGGVSPDASPRVRRLRHGCRESIRSIFRNRFAPERAAKPLLAVRRQLPRLSAPDRHPLAPALF